MGLNIYGARFLLAEKARGITFGRTLTLGKQAVYMSCKEYSSLPGNNPLPNSIPEFADDFFRNLGTNPLISMDASAYEGATLIHDMNELIDHKFHSSFDTVIDGGTLEHVFNFPSAIQNCMNMVKVGGHLILMTPWHGYAGHGFYQFSPELIYNILSKENGFRVEKMLIVAGGYWYSVEKPEKVKARIEIATNQSIDLYVSACRTDKRPLFSQWPQQSDYSAAWGSLTSHSGNDKRVTLKSRFIEIAPPVERLQSWWRKFKRASSLSPSNNRGLLRLCPSSEIPK